MRPERWTWPANVRRAIIAQAKAAAPNECCGLLIGTRRRISMMIALRNAAVDPRRQFRVDDADHVTVRRWLRGQKPAREIIGVYHSHPSSPARPSPTDLAEWHYPDWVSVIVGPAEGRTFVRGCRIVNGESRPVVLAVATPRSRPAR